VRVPHMDLKLAARCLDGGALGIVVPHVDTPEEAKAVVDALRFAPVGHRSVAGGYPQYGFGTVPVVDAVREMNAATLLVVMIETPRAVENAVRIAAVPGIDVLLMGTNDLSLEMGIPGKLDDPKLVAALDTVLAACKKHGKWPGLGGVYAKPLLGTYLAKGFKFVLCGNDLGLLMAAASEQAGFVKKS
jgi:4-hydroxy-2-oxoheptanedioate aldolase